MKPLRAELVGKATLVNCGMKKLPAIGSRVKAVYGNANQFVPGRECIGKVVAHYRGFTYRDEETGDLIEVSDHVGVKVDVKPEWWPYHDTDRFAPSIDNVSPVPDADSTPVLSGENKKSAAALPTKEEE